MSMFKKFAFISACTVLLAWLVGDQFNRDDAPTVPVKKLHPIDAAAEIETWKKELVAQKLLGAPCRFEALDSPEAGRWRQENPDQANGLPRDDKEIGTAQHDFDGDGKLDLLLYFNSQNCSGRNGDTPWFAKIIYASGRVNADVVSDIREAIFEAYSKMRDSNPRLQEVTRDYSDEAISMSYAAQVGGNFQLYAQGDAHCCPSYKGAYTYDPYSKQIHMSGIEKASARRMP